MCLPPTTLLSHCSQCKPQQSESKFELWKLQSQHRSKQWERAEGVAAEVVGLVVGAVAGSSTAELPILGRRLAVDGEGESSSRIRLF